MKTTARNLLTSSLALALLSMSNPALAQSDNSGTFFGKSAPGKWIIGVKGAKVDPNLETVNDAEAVGIVLGYEFAKEIGRTGGTSSFELEVLQSDSEPILPGTSYETDIVNAFFTYRSPGTVYYKLKGGISWVTVEVNSTDPALNTELEDASLALGVGLGYRIQDRGAVELEYSQDTGDADLGVLGVTGYLNF